MRAITNPHRPFDRLLELILLVRASSRSRAGRVMGSFTLPVAVRWGICTLPAGETTFVVPAAAFRSWVYVRGGNDAAVLFAASSERATGAPMSELRLFHDGSGYRVRSLVLRDTQTILHFEERRSLSLPPEAERWRGILSLLPTGVRRRFLEIHRSPSIEKCHQPGVFAIGPSRPTPQRPR